MALKLALSRGDDATWLSPPSDADVMAEFQKQWPDLEVPDPPMIIKTLVYEELFKRCPLNFQVHTHIHRVRYRCEVIIGEPGFEIEYPVIIDRNHYHLNGSGLQPLYVSQADGATQK